MISKKNLFTAASWFRSKRFYIFLAMYILAGYHILSLDPEIDRFFLPEDHYFETIGAISFFATSVLFFYGFWLLRSIKPATRYLFIKKIALLGLAAAFFFAAGEEISWGQRIFNIETPETLSEINVQDEITIHNINFGGWGIPFETLFDLLWAGLVVFVPLVSLYGPAGEFLVQFSPIPHLGVGMLFIFNYLWAKVAKFIYLDFYNFATSVPFVQAVQEIKESNYSVLLPSPPFPPWF